MSRMCKILKDKENCKQARGKLLPVRQTKHSTIAEKRNMDVIRKRKAINAYKDKNQTLPIQKCYEEELAQISNQGNSKSQKAPEL